MVRHSDHVFEGSRRDDTTTENPGHEVCPDHEQEASGRSIAGWLCHDQAAERRVGAVDHRRGGTSVDAAVGLSLVLTHCYPELLTFRGEVELATDWHRRRAFDRLREAADDQC
jgi:hypothetical protein